LFHFCNIFARIKAFYERLPSKSTRPAYSFSLSCVRAFWFSNKRS
jgi:hypothetical protein